MGVNLYHSSVSFLFPSSEGLFFQLDCVEKVFVRFFVCLKMEEVTGINGEDVETN